MNRLWLLAWSALGAGVAAGLVLAALQAVWISPLIAEAEVYELDHAEPAAVIGEGAHNDGAPASARERLAFSVLSDMVAGVGFALLLCAAMSLAPRPVTPMAGLLWGAGGYAAFMLAPSLGLPPVLPGDSRADLMWRQLWWVATAACTAGGLALLAFGRGWGRMAAVALLLAPHVVGAPQPPMDQTSRVPEDLPARFVLAMLVSTAIFWAVLGVACAWLRARLRPQQAG